MKTANKLQTLSEINFYNTLNSSNFVKIGTKLYSVYCVAVNRIDVYTYEDIFILQDSRLKKIYFPSDTKATFIMWLQLTDVNGS